MRRALLLLPLLGAGCLVPQEIEEMDPPRVGNDAPRIVVRTPSATEIRTQQRCAALSFSVEQLEDFDTGDDLEVRWFVNYGEGNPVPERVSVSPGSPDLVDGLRSGSEFTFDPKDFGSGTFLVEVVVSDGFDPNPDAEPLNRAVLPGKDVDETSWHVLVLSAPECLE